MSKLCPTKTTAVINNVLRCTYTVYSVYKFTKHDVDISILQLFNEALHSTNLQFVPSILYQRRSEPGLFISKYLQTSVKYSNLAPCRIENRMLDCGCKLQGWARSTCFYPFRYRLVTTAIKEKFQVAVNFKGKNGTFFSLTVFIVF